jgi:hypothetical protein
MEEEATVNVSETPPSLKITAAGDHECNYKQKL